MLRKLDLICRRTLIKRVCGLQSGETISLLFSQSSSGPVHQLVSSLIHHIATAHLAREGALRLHSTPLPDSALLRLVYYSQA